MRNVLFVFFIIVNIVYMCLKVGSSHFQTLCMKVGFTLGQLKNMQMADALSLNTVRYRNCMPTLPLGGHAGRSSFFFIVSILHVINGLTLKIFCFISLHKRKQ